MSMKDIHPNVLKCTTDREHMNEEFLTAIRKHIEDTETKRLKCAPISLMLIDLKFFSSSNWKIKFEDVRHDRFYVVTHEYSVVNADKPDDETYDVYMYQAEKVWSATPEFNE